MILSTLEKTLKTLGAPLLWADETGLPPFTAIQGITVTCTDACSDVRLSSLLVVNSHISATFSATINGQIQMLCYLDSEVVSNTYNYPLIGSSTEFVDGCVTIFGLPTGSIEYNGTKMFVNPLYIQWVKASMEAKTPTLRIGRASDENMHIEVISETPLDTLRITSTRDIETQTENDTTKLNIVEQATGVPALDLEKITAINGSPIKNGVCTIDLRNTGIRAKKLANRQSYVELLGNGEDSCPTTSYLKNAFAPNGRVYDCPVDILYEPKSDPGALNNTADASSYDITRLDNKRFNTEYSGDQLADGCFEGLLWYEFNKLHDVEPVE